MSDLLSDLRKLPLRRNKAQHAITRKNRSAMLVMRGKQLMGLGYADLTVTSLEKIHITALLSLWESQELDKSTRRNRLSVLRWWARLINKEDLLASGNIEYGLGERRYRRIPIPTVKGKKYCWDCGKNKDLAAFTRSKRTHEGRTNICLDCGRKRAAVYDLTHREQKRAYDATHKHQRQQRELKRVLQLLPSGKYHRRGAYIIQLEADRTLCKIGKTIDFASRAIGLAIDYGAFQVLMLIPHEDPALMERLLHRYFDHMRIYSEGKRELFRFDTRAKQRTFERFQKDLARFQINPVSWKEESKNQELSSSPLQGTLFA